MEFVSVCASRMQGVAMLVFLSTHMRGLDASELSRREPTPKKRMRGLTPVSFCKVDARKTPKEVFGDPKNSYM